MRRFTPYILLALLVLLFYRQAVFTNLIFARGDTFLYFYPYWDYRNASLMAGHLPLWNPYLFMGVPFLANSQAGVFYPLNWPLAFFTAPVAVKISIVAHVIIAAWGTFLLARRAFQLDLTSAFFAAILLSLGGYLTAQVEHVNQLQGLAWLPFALLSTYQLSTQHSAPSARRSALFVHCSLLSLFIALQLTAGHTQTTFITLVACTFVALFNLCKHFNFKVSRLALHSPRSTLWAFGIWGFGILLAFALAAIQLVPALELSRLSLRGGGLSLNEAVSFSLNPLLLGRALLPSYSRPIFSEYVAYIGIIPLVLAALAIITQYELRITNSKLLIATRNPQFSNSLILSLLLALLGLFFAFGGYNPIYLLLAKFAPGFNLFRVPARWLALWALGAALLAGYGLQSLSHFVARLSDSQSRLRPLAPLLLLPLLLITLAFLSAPLTPAGELGPMGFPSAVDLALWLAPLLIPFIVLHFTPFASRITWSTEFGFLRFWLLGISLIEIFLASHSLPLNHLTAPTVYTSIRPALTQLLAHNPICDPQSEICSPPDRFLSLSQLVFDPGDLAELHSEWDSQLPPDAVYDAIIATKYQEVISPNLPLTWRVPSVDGYDGGILPLRAYAEFAQQFGDVPEQTDGRLRQFLKTIPPNSLLTLTNTRWIITDKTGDAWVDNVFYDLGLAATAISTTPLTFTRLPDFEATALGLVLDSNAQSGAAQITFTNGETVTLPITYDPIQPAPRLRWHQPATVSQIVILTPTTLTLRGASLIDERTDSFQSITLGPYRLAHSGDVKIYENLNVLPRAFLATEIQSPISNSSTLRVQTTQSNAKILKYNAEHVVIQTNSDTPGYLVLTDSNYPGWIATVDGQPVPIETAYGLFRASALPAGHHTIEYIFDPPSLKQGAAISSIALATWLTFLILALTKNLSGNSILHAKSQI